MAASVSQGSTASLWVRRIVLVVLGLIWLVPVYLFLANAAKTTESYGISSVWAPEGIAGLWSNIADAWDRGRLSRGFLSTAVYALVAPLLAVVVGAAAGFAIVALRLRHGFVWFVVIFASTIFPLQMILMPLFLGYAETGLYDSRQGMILVYTAISVPFAAFVMRNFFSGIAHQVFEAAVVDGAGTWRIFWRIYLPMSMSALVAVYILQATLIWNDLLLGLTLAQSETTRPLMPALSAMQSTYGGSTMPTVLAGGLLVSIPTVALFLLTQRVFSRGLSLGQF
ncbi:binding-protein-dependent transport systems inner membrane component [Beutenbergia cavernae DSM 12333]|uniref:Binding-protein-dependent transport systems inner membrane component n=1 Tax=Beutenbergia cavernae (strain ATCC BAA-8 / DSM 12333 / CCUG 43141 / JCM 11478 / NBRC 16432 / NCIMB 13614 / HKI 0122) TaxID=471853 RepID=C5BY46_BEUC1|nr:carbohydrate ABC transporter permease [Beutenbergia cavernae]ACQ80946.1 binding-protein-dependent transport systems inner membrane component [Beutenbergia cavernae DSM 12333]